MLGTNKKINQLVNDLTFQKRVSIFNTIIIICLLVYVILTRDVDIEIQEDHDIEEDEEVLVTDEKRWTTQKKHL